VEETPEDFARLQALLDWSYEQSGEHLREVITPERRIDARALATLMTGVRVLALATVTADGRPLVGPVDGLFYRGHWWFGSSPRAVRIRHLRARTSVSATHTIGEELAVTVHGQARIVDLEHGDQAGFAAHCLAVYGPEWHEWGAPATYARIEPDRLYTFAAASE